MAETPTPADDEMADIDALLEAVGQQLAAFAKRLHEAQTHDTPGSGRAPEGGM